MKNLKFKENYIFTVPLFSNNSTLYSLYAYTYLS